MVFKKKPADPIDGIVNEGIKAMKELVKMHEKNAITREQKYVGIVATVALMYNALIGLAETNGSLRDALYSLIEESKQTRGDSGEGKKTGIM